jgi:hypothetical protein
MVSEAGQLSARIVIENSTNRPRIAWVEPWGEDYTLLSKERLEIIARGDSESPWFHVVEYDQGAQIWIEGSSDYDVVQNGIKLECGHQRQAGLDAGLQF